MRSLAKMSILITAALAALLFAGASAKPSSQSGGTGEEWLSWTPEQRSVYVDAYLTGYTSGKTDACIAAAELFEVHKRVTPEDTLDRRCFRHSKTYSRSRDDYASLLTEFYARCPERKNIPYAYLMIQLTDDRYKTAEVLCHAAEKGEIRANF